jgi:drug/metabolite transporter superfamily protein YnfA
MEYLRAFVIGSSFLVFFPHFLAVAGLDERKLNYTYKQYTFVAPVYYGLLNMISLFIAISFGLSSRQRYLLVGSLSPLIVVAFSYSFQTYDYEGREWLTYGAGLFVKHFLIWNIVVFLLDKYV